MVMVFYKRLIVAFFMSFAAFVCLVLATAGVPENSLDATDTLGLPPVTIYSMVILVLNLTAVVLSVVGMIAFMKLRSASFGAKLAIFLVSNTLLVLVALLSVFVITAYVPWTYTGIIGVIANLIVVGVVVSAAPSRASSESLV